MVKTHEQLWNEMDALFQEIQTENYRLKTAMKKAMDEIQRLEVDPDYGIAWDAQAILREALKPVARTKEGWDV